jgi:hypothetical protein
MLAQALAYEADAVPPCSSSSACSPAMMPAMPLNTCAVFSAGAMKFLSPSVCRMYIPILMVLLILLSCMRYLLVTPGSSPGTTTISLCSTYSARLSLTVPSLIRSLLPVPLLYSCRTSNSAKHSCNMPFLSTVSRTGSVMS